MRSRSLRAALAEGRAARRWYLRERGQASGENFARAYSDARANIRRWPRSGQAIGNGRRRMIVEGFPYELIYEIHDDTAVIIAVAHSSRQPGYWRDRTS